MPDRPSGADWDPVSAKLYRPSEIKKDSGEATSGPPVQFGTCRVKIVGLYSTIKTNQDQANSQSNQYLDIRTPSANSHGAGLTADNFVVHRGKRYDIVGTMNTDYRLGTTRYQVNVSNDFNFAG